MIDRLHRHVLLRLDPEKAHRLATTGLEIFGALVGVRRGSRWISRAVGLDEATLPLARQIGVAGGFDKNAEWLPWLPALGFGFAEVGTVTPRAQAGHPRPRLWRMSDGGGGGLLLNKMGFNNDGAEAVAARVKRARPFLPESFEVWANIGKNADTPVERAEEDYARAAETMAPWVHALVLNLSSPNTPGLRSLQTVEALRKILAGIAHEGAGKRMYIKLAPEVGGDDLRDLLREFENEARVAGWILTNTLAGSWTWTDGTEVRGGWSGSLLKDHARARLVEARKLTQKEIISVGGISDADDMAWRFQHGAQRVQVYTGWVYGGPTWLPAVLKRLSQKQKQP